MLKEGHLFLNIVRMCMQGVTAIGYCVHDLRHFVQNGPPLQTLDRDGISKKDQKGVLKVITLMLQRSIGSFPFVKGSKTVPEHTVKPQS